MASSVWGAGYYEGLEKGIEKGLEQGLSKGRGQGAGIGLAVGALITVGTLGYQEVRKRRDARQQERQAESEPVEGEDIGVRGDGAPDPA